MKLRKLFISFCFAAISIFGLGQTYYDDPSSDDLAVPSDYSLYIIEKGGNFKRVGVIADPWDVVWNKMNVNFIKLDTTRTFDYFTFSPQASAPSSLEKGQTFFESPTGYLLMYNGTDYDTLNASGGGGSTYIFTGGLSESGGTVQLGDTIDQTANLVVDESTGTFEIKTPFTLRSGQFLIFEGILGMYAFNSGNYSGDYARSSVSVQSDRAIMATTKGSNDFSSRIILDTTQMLIDDDANSKGLYYALDYSSGATDRWLPDKAYVDAIGGGAAGDVHMYGTPSGGDLVFWRNDTTVQAYTNVDTSKLRYLEDVNRDIREALDSIPGAYAAGSSYNFGTGLYNSSGTVHLGDTVDDNIILADTSGAHYMFLGLTNYPWRYIELVANDQIDIGVNDDTGSVIIGLSDMGDLKINLDTSGIVVTDEYNKGGIRLGGDYSSYFTDSSLIDKQYADGAYEAELDNSAGLRNALSDETGTGVAVFGTSPTFTTQITIGDDVLTEADVQYLKTINRDLEASLDSISALYEQVNDTVVVPQSYVWGFSDSVQIVANRDFIPINWVGTDDTLSLDSIWTGAVTVLTPNLSFNMYVNDTLNTTATSAVAVFSDWQTIGAASTTVGQYFTPDNRAYVLPGEKIWLRFNSVATKPEHGLTIQSHGTVY